MTFYIDVYLTFYVDVYPTRVTFISDVLFQERLSRLSPAIGARCRVLAELWRGHHGSPAT